MNKSWTRCSGSGEIQMLAWMPTEKDNYPGAVVCLGCSGGVLVRKGSAHKATSQTGFEGMAGTVRTHYVKGDRIRYSKPNN